MGASGRAARHPRLPRCASAREVSAPLVRDAGCAQGGGEPVDREPGTQECRASRPLPRVALEERHWVSATLAIARAPSTRIPFSNERMRLKSLSRVMSVQPNSRAVCATSRSFCHDAPIDAVAARPSTRQVFARAAALGARAGRQLARDHARKRGVRQGPFREFFELQPVRRAA